MAGEEQYTRSGTQFGRRNSFSVFAQRRSTNFDSCRSLYSIENGAVGANYYEMAENAQRSDAMNLVLSTRQKLQEDRIKMQEQVHKNTMPAIYVVSAKNAPGMSTQTNLFPKLAAQ